MVAQEAPKVVFWFRVYTACMTALYVLCLLAAPVLAYVSLRTSGEEAVMLRIQAGILGVVGLIFSVVFALPWVLPRRPWVWVYDLVLIGIGLTSCCILPAALPLLIYWLKPEVKAWFKQG